MAGKHLITSWSKTQAVVALSSAEAELTALVKTSCEAIGLTQLAKEWGIPMEADILVDSSAAIGVVNRKGNGRLRHVRIGQLWVQEKRENEELRFTKVKGTCNPADLMTKGVGKALKDEHLAKMGVKLGNGRADASLSI